MNWTGGKRMAKMKVKDELQKQRDFFTRQKIRSRLSQTPRNSVKQFTNLLGPNSPNAWEEHEEDATNESSKRKVQNWDLKYLERQSVDLDNITSSKKAKKPKMLANMALWDNEESENDAPLQRSLMSSSSSSSSSEAPSASFKSMSPILPNNRTPRESEVVWYQFFQGPSESSKPANRSLCDQHLLSNEGMPSDLKVGYTGQGSFRTSMESPDLRIFDHSAGQQGEGQYTPTSKIAGSVYSEYALGDLSVKSERTKPPMSPTKTHIQKYPIICAVTSPVKSVVRLEPTDTIIRSPTIDAAVDFSDSSSSVVSVERPGSEGERSEPDNVVQTNPGERAPNTSPVAPAETKRDLEEPPQSPRDPDNPFCASEDQHAQLPFAMLTEMRKKLMNMEQKMLAQEQEIAALKEMINRIAESKQEK
ncbi:hypothetical protein HK102_009398 [Quaeritorhiza haematococci]|nr:hypothetical protein HK102_009398 [Quaeritorhiza haematococci]